ncbi:GntR family transcriptional regulator [Roseobacter sp. EG26]|uniref:GntR family transcriptional regulator n=1 Tax=Roseobacter sp. EG26 TaxID=3412477 RepID=UPI003CE568CC
MNLGQSSADRVYHAVRDMAVAFAFKPGERINELNLAKTLGTSRTPLREALNRLSAEGFLTFQTGQGFSCRSLDPGDILDLYEARQAVECEAVWLAAGRATDDDIDAIIAFLEQTEQQYHDGSPVETLVNLDEEFHMRMVRLSGNREMARLLANLNARLRFVRWIDMEELHGITPRHHFQIITALQARDGEAAVAAMRDHITRRREQATEAARKAVLRLYVPG